MKKFLLFPFFLALSFGLLYAEPEVSEEVSETPMVAEAPVLPEWPAEHGTGFFVSHNGVIVTCAHLVEGKSRIMVRIGNTDHPAEVLAKNSNIGLAALKINQRNARHFGIVGFNTVTLGDRASVLGYPVIDALGSDIRVESGIVSARNGINANQTYFQTSAPIRPGSDGGPIFNNRFRLIGVATSQPRSDIGALASFALAAHDIHFGIKSDFIVPAIGGNIALGRGNVKSINDAIRATVQVRTYTRKAVTIVNNTGYEARRAYLRLSGESSWGEDRLGGNVLVDGRSMEMSIPIAGRYDIRLVDLDDDPYTQSGVNLAPGQTVEFVFGDIHAGENENVPQPGATLASGPGDASLPTITIANRTGQTVRAIYVSPSMSDRWGDDVLGTATLGNGESVTLRLLAPLDATDQYDLRITTADGEDHTQMRTKLSPNQTVEFTARSAASEDESSLVWATLSTEPGDDALPTITITNSTGYLIYRLYISPSAAGEWGRDILGTEVLDRDESVTVRLLTSLDDIDEYDLRLTDSDGDDYRKMGVKLSPNQTIEFIFDDIDN
ncbi:MAG: serine protease [Chitinispirillales bacterium]|nr:serine protease [Chitinispirillales bacterium]